MLFKACVLLDQFSDKLCKSVLSRVEAGLEMQTNVHFDIKWVDLPMLSLNPCRPVPDGSIHSIENQNVFSRADSETSAIQEDFLGLAFI